MSEDSCTTGLRITMSEPRHTSHDGWDCHEVTVTAEADGRTIEFPFRSGLALPPVPDEMTVKAAMFYAWQDVEAYAEPGNETEALLVHLIEDMGMPVRGALAAVRQMLDTHTFVSRMDTDELELELERDDNF